jgi:hypothetical protein
MEIYLLGPFGLASLPSNLIEAAKANDTAS